MVGTQEMLAVLKGRNMNVNLPWKFLCTRLQPVCSASVYMNILLSSTACLSRAFSDIALQRLDKNECSECTSSTLPQKFFSIKTIENKRLAAPTLLFILPSLHYLRAVLGILT